MRAVEAALDTIDALLGAFDLVHLTKIDRDPLTNEGLDGYVDELVRAMRRAGTTARDGALRVVSEDLAEDWGTLSEDQREAIYTAARARIAAEMSRFVDAIAATIPSVARDLIATTRRRTVQRHNLRAVPGTTFDLADRRAIAHVRRTGLLFMRARLGDVVGKTVVARTRSVVAEALRQGISAREAARTLARQARLVVDAASERYFAICADTLMTRGRTFSQLKAFEAAGIQRFTFDAVLDNVTCNACRFLDGHTWEVSAAIRKMEEAEDARTIEELREKLPFLRVRRDGVYVERGGELRQLARAIPAEDEVAPRLEALVSDEELLEIGACFPPLHGYCRCTITPGDMEVIAPPAQPEPPTPDEVRIIGGRPTIGPEPGLVAAHRDPERAWRDAGVSGDFSVSHIREVFGDRVPTSETLERAWSAGPLRFKLKHVDWEDDLLRFEGDLLNAKGEKRNIHPVRRTAARVNGALVMEHELFALHKDERKTGAARGMVTNALRAYTHLGVNKVVIAPAWDGTYTWPSFGWDWRDRRVIPDVTRNLTTWLQQHAPAAVGLAPMLAEHPWRIADFGATLPRVRVRSHSPGTEGDVVELPVGRAFLYLYKARFDGPSYSGFGELELDLTDARSPSFVRAREKLFRP